MLHFEEEFELLANVSIDDTGLLFPFFPIKTSAIKTGKPNVITKKI